MQGRQQQTLARHKYPSTIYFSWIDIAVHCGDHLRNQNVLFLSSANQCHFVVGFFPFLDAPAVWFDMDYGSWFNFLDGCHEGICSACLGHCIDCPFVGEGVSVSYRNKSTQVFSFLTHETSKQMCELLTLKYVIPPDFL